MALLLAAPLGLTLLLAPAELPPEVGLVEAAGPALPVAPEGTLTALMDAPARRLGESVAVVAQFREEIADWNPYLTRFAPATHRCVEVWGDEQHLWIKDEYEAPLARLFVRRGTLAEAALDAARAHDRFELDLVVRELQAGSAWTEITHATLARQQTPEGTVLHAIRALDLIEREGWRLALSELDRALAPDLPEHARAALTAIRDEAQATWDALQARTLR